MKQKLNDVLKDFEIENLNGTNSNVALENARHILNSF